MEALSPPECRELSGIRRGGSAVDHP